MSVNNRGTSLLTFNTNRQPDSDRGKGIKHFELSSPTHIKDEIDRWEKGDRPVLDPREAAKMLWSTKTASHLDGRLDAWKNVPGVNLLLPGWQLITEIPQDSWPKDQNELQKFITEAGSPGTKPEDFIARLKILDGEMTAADFLNDLLLIFKYAAIGYQRPIHLVADLYRLARTLLEDKKNAPLDRTAMFAWLTAPLVVPRVFTAPLGPSGAKAPLQGDIGDIGSKPSSSVSITRDTPQGRAIIEQIERDLDEINKLDAEEATISAIRKAGSADPKAVADIIKSIRENNSLPPATKSRRVIRRVTPAPRRRTSRIVSTNIGGFPVRVNMAEIEKRADQSRRERTKHLIATLPEDLKNRINALDADEYVMELPDGNSIDEWTVSHHPEIPPLPSYLEPAGRTDLLIVRQTTTGYRRAEIAHAENVLIGEKRERDHTKRILTRDELFESTERESEETTDLQTTDSSKLSNEISEVVSEDLRAEGSVEVTYRGATKVVAKAAGSFEKNTENAANAATEYATEILNRAIKRLSLRTKRETTSLFEQEIVEENRHHFTRADDADEHVSGVYQNLERISRAKIFSYGERDIYDILVPEPAALIWNLSISPVDEFDISVDQPDESLFDSITLDGIADKRKELIKSFKVIDFPPIPEEEKTIDVPFSDKQVDGDSDNNVYVAHHTKRIDEGYIVVKAACTVYAEQEGNDDKALGSITIGKHTQQWSLKPDNAGRRDLEFIFDPPLTGPEIGIAINVENHVSTTGNIVISLALSDEKRREWQLEAYGRVAARYDQMQQDFELARLRAEATQPIEEMELPVGARRRLKKMVHNELQRAAIGIMRNAPVNFDLIHDVAEQGPPYPTTDLPALKSAEPVIRFLQQAFEWEHLSWALYPYFWGRRSVWENSVDQDHPDPDFAAFLNAGAARLQISVRPGFQDLVKHFMETGEVYEGNGLPKMGDSGYMPFIDEQINALSGPGEEVPWPPGNPREWDVVTPTALVLVRKVAEKQLPTWDADSGEEN